MEEREHEDNNTPEEEKFFEAELFVDSAELSDYLFVNLIEEGLAPTPDETDLVADLVIDWLLMKFLMQEPNEEE